MTHPASLCVSPLRVDAAGRTILRSPAFQLHCGEALALMGPNGSGKSTLLDVISGATKATSGRIEWRGRRLWGPAWLRTRRGIGRLLQSSPPADARITAREFLSLSPGFSAAFGAPQISARTSRLVQALELQAHLECPLHQLSFGTFRLFQFAQLMATPLSLALLDEPLAGIDERRRDTLVAITTEHLHTGGLAIIATHGLQRFGAIVNQRLELGRD